jgi:mono/diheme cytochrome c family protein
MPMPDPLDSPELARSLDRTYVLGLFCMLLLVIAFPLYKLQEPSRRKAAHESMERESVSLGRGAFDLHCAGCHGPGGTGNGVGPTLASREFLSLVSDQQLEWLIAGGIPGSPMGAYHIDLGGPFTAQEITRVARYLRSMEATAPSVDGWRDGKRAATSTARPAAAPTGAR